MTLKIDASHYHDNSSIQFKLAEDVLDLHEFVGNEDVLDVGCGDGNVTVKLAEKVPNGSVDGLDPSSEMIEFAISTFPPEQFQNLSFNIGAAESLESAQKYDLITAFSCLHWVRGQEKAFERLTNALKDKGRLLILTFPKESPYWRILEEVIYDDKWRKYASSSVCEHWVTSENYKKIFNKLNLKELYVQTTHEISTYESVDDFKNYVKGWLPCLIQIEEELQEDFLDDLAANAKRHYGDDDEAGLKIPYNKIIMYLEQLQTS